MRILIIPELEEKVENWLPVVNVLEKIGYVVNVLDYTTPKSDDIEEQTNYAEHFLVDKTVVVGSGVGGRIAVQLLARHHHQIVAAILFSTPSLIHSSLLSKILKLVGIFLLPFKLFLSYKLQKKISNAIMGIIYSNKRKLLYAKVTSSNQDTLLPIIKNKVRLVWSQKRSRVHKSVAYKMKELLPNCDLVFVADGVEPLHVSAPLLVANYIDEYARPS